jgi:hypothetical protein
MFKEIGDEGEVWQVSTLSRFEALPCVHADGMCVRLCRFGEDAAQDMVEWAEEHFPQTDGRILDGADCPFPLPPLVLETSFCSGK